MYNVIVLLAFVFSETYIYFKLLNTAGTTVSWPFLLISWSTHKAVIQNFIIKT